MPDWSAVELLVEGWRKLCSLCGAASFLLGERGKLSHFEKGVEEEAEISLAAYCVGCGGGGGGGGWGWWGSPCGGKEMR